MSDKSLSAPASNNGLNMPTVTIKCANSVVLMPQTSQALPGSSLPNPVPHQNFSIYSSAPYFMGDPPVLIGDSTSSSIFGSLCMPTNSISTSARPCQQYINFANNCIGVDPQGQPQTYLNINSAQPSWLLPNVPSSSSSSGNSVNNDNITSKAQPSVTPAMSNITQQCYPNASLNNCAIEINMASGTPSSAAPGVAMPEVSPPPPYPNAQLSNCGITFNVAHGTLSTTVPVIVMSMVQPPPPYPNVPVNKCGVEVNAASVKPCSPSPASVGSTLPPSLYLNTPSSNCSIKIEPALNQSTILNSERGEAQTPITGSYNSSQVSAKSPPPYSAAISNNCIIKVEPGSESTDLNSAQDTLQTTMTGDSNFFNMCSKSPSPYFTALPGNCNIKIEPTSANFDSAPDETQTQVVESDDAFDMSGLMFPIREEIDDSQAEELTIEVDPSNYLDCSDTDSPEKDFPMYESDEPDCVAYEQEPSPNQLIPQECDMGRQYMPQPCEMGRQYLPQQYDMSHQYMPQSSSTTPYLDQYGRLAKKPIPINTYSRQKSEERNVQLQHDGENPLLPHNVSNLFQAHRIPNILLKQSTMPQSATKIVDKNSELYRNISKLLSESGNFNSSRTAQCSHQNVPQSNPVSKPCFSQYKPKIPTPAGRLPSFKGSTTFQNVLPNSMPQTVASISQPSNPKSPSVVRRLVSINGKSTVQDVLPDGSILQKQPVVPPSVASIYESFKSIRLPRTKFKPISSSAHPNTASLPQTISSLDSTPKSDAIRKLLSNKCFTQTCNSDKGSPTRYFFTEQIYTPDGSTTKPQFPSVSRIQIPKQNQHSTAEMPRLVSSLPNDTSAECSEHLFRIIVERQIELASSPVSHPEVPQVPNSPLDFTHSIYDEHNYFSRSKKYPVYRAPKSHAVPVKRLLFRRCRVVLKKLHPSHFRRMSVNLKNVAEEDLFKASWSRKRNDHKFYGRSHPILEKSKSPHGEMQRELLEADVLDTANIETPSVKLQVAAPTLAHLVFDEPKSPQKKLQGKAPLEDLVVGTVKIEPPPVKVRVLEPPSVKVRVLEPSSVKVRVLEPSSVKVRVLEPPSVKVRVLEPPSVKARVLEPPSVKARVLEPPSVKVQVVEPPSVKVRVLEPPSVNVRIVKPPSVKARVLEPPSVKVQVVEPPSVKVRVLEPPSVKARVFEPPSVNARVLEPPSVNVRVVKPPAVTYRVVKPTSFKVQVVKPPSFKVRALKPRSFKVQAVKPPSVKVPVVEPPSVKVQAVDQPSQLSVYKTININDRNAMKQHLKRQLVVRLERLENVQRLSLGRVLRS